MAKNKSPLYNYRSPRDYKVFNMGNEMRQDPTFEGTDEYRKVEDIPAHEYERRGLKKPKSKKKKK